MRLFIAVPLPAVALSEAGSLLRRLREHEWPVRWVREEGMHVTLKFFGEVTHDRALGIEDMLRHAADGIARFRLVFGKCGVFPSLRRPRVIRVELQSGNAAVGGAGRELEVLQDRIERASSDLGFPPEGRPFIPHVTLGRVREGHRLPADAASALDGLPSGGGTAFLVDRVVLFESRLTGAGPEYSTRSSEALA